MNFDMLEMEVVRIFDLEIGKKNVTSVESALNLTSCAGMVATTEMLGDDSHIEQAIGALVHSIIIYCETKNLTLTKCLEKIV